MKTILTILLAVSACVMGAFLFRGERTVALNSSLNTASNRPVARLEEKANAAPSKQAASLPVLTNFQWTSLESADYKEYIRNLRAIGCPEDVLRDIILADVNKNYAAKEDPLRAQIMAWRQQEQAASSSTDSTAIRRSEYLVRKQLREIELDKKAFIKELLNYEIPLEPLRGWRSRTYERYEAALRSLPPEKRERAREIQELYWLSSDTLREKYPEQRTPAYVEEYKRINEQRAAQLSMILSPPELEDYEMRSSSLPGRLSEQLKHFKPTESEFREIYRATKNIETPFGGGLRADLVETPNPQDDEMRRKASMEMLEKVLGPERYADYQRSQDPDYQRLALLGEQFDLPEPKIREVQVIYKAAQTKMAQLQTKHATEAQNFSQPQLRDITESQIRDLIGERAAKKVMRNWTIPQPPTSTSTRLNTVF